MDAEVFSGSKCQKVHFVSCDSFRTYINIKSKVCILLESSEKVLVSFRLFAWGNDWRHDSKRQAQNVERLFVCVEVLRPSQPSGVMSNAVSLPNHTFTGQA